MFKVSPSRFIDVKRCMIDRIALPGLKDMKDFEMAFLDELKLAIFVELNQSSFIMILLLSLSTDNLSEVRKGREQHLRSERQAQCRPCPQRYLWGNSPEYL